jgi:hypothetical protein
MLLLDPLDNMRHGEADQNGNPGDDPALEQFSASTPSQDERRNVRTRSSETWEGSPLGFLWRSVVCPHIFKKMANKIWIYLSFHSFFLHIRDFIVCPGFSLILKKGENRSIKEIGFIYGGKPFQNSLI